MVDGTEVTALMVTGKDPARYCLARRAVQSFLEQTYPYKRLVILNDGPEAVLGPDNDDKRLVEHRISRNPEYTLGELRNLALGLVETPYVVQWDDDDYSSPERLAFQVRETPSGVASVFQWQVRCDLTSPDLRAFVYCAKRHVAGGLESTLLFPIRFPERYPAVRRGEDTQLARLLHRRRVLHVISNRATDHICFYHGRNTWLRQHIMQFAAGSRELLPSERSFVRRIAEEWRECHG